MCEHVHRGLARDPALLGEQNAFGKCQHLDGKTEVDGDFHRQGQAVPSDVSDLGPDVLEQRFDTIEGGAVSSDHHRQLALLERHDAARHRRVNHVGALFPDLGRNCPADGGADRAHVDHDFAGAKAREQSVTSLRDRFERLRIGDHDENDVGRLAYCAGRLSQLHPLIDQPVRLSAAKT